MVAQQKPETLGNAPTGRGLETSEYLIRRSGEWYTHRLIWRSGTFLFEQAEAETPGASHFAIAAAALTYFALEAYLNFLGARFRPEVWEREREFFNGTEYRGTIGKLDYISSELGVAFDRGARPFQTVKTLQARRDGVVHPKPEVFDEVVRVSDPSDSDRDTEYYELGEMNFLSRARSDVEAVCDRLQAAARADGVKGLHSDRAFTGFIGSQGGSLLEGP